ncbi:alginate lyase family protein [Pedobacter sp. PAMC26386]|nr:alginate lyase family protein [Pedobacter sp. PAMC26386]
MRNKFFCIVLAILYGQFSFAQAPKLFLINAGQLKAKKEAWQEQDKKTKSLIAPIISKAVDFLTAKPKSVMDKISTPPSGSKHDYMSQAPYFWPDPSKPNGTPYIRKDGERNPDIRKITDAAFLHELTNQCKFLSLAYYFTGQEKYATKAIELLHAWFIAPETKMNPNLNYAQAIPGINDGRGIGIIESRSLIELADWMGLLATSKSLSVAETEGIKTWYKQYLDWLLTSKNGKDEHRSKNNHGTIYDAQVASFALFTDNEELAKNTLTASLQRIAIQITPEGEQPLELARTKAYSYSTMNLNDGWFNLALLGERAGIDVWNYQTTDGRSIHKALDWLIPYGLEEKTKDRKQIIPYNSGELYRLLVLAGRAYKNKTYLKQAASIKQDKETQLTDLLYN